MEKLVTIPLKDYKLLDFMIKEIQETIADWEPFFDTDLINTKVYGWIFTLNGLLVRMNKFIDNNPFPEFKFLDFEDDVEFADFLLFKISDYLQSPKFCGFFSEYIDEIYKMRKHLSKMIDIVHEAVKGGD